MPIPETVPVISKLSVVIPCCNEAENLRRFEGELFPVLAAFPFPTEYILIDDGSVDPTFDEMEKLKTKAHVKIARHQMNLGLGMALQSGFALADGDAILTLDADLTFHPSEIETLLAGYAPEVAAVFGSPLLGRMEGVNFFRKILSQGVNIVYRILLSKPITSASSIFRLYRADKLQGLNLTSASFDINAEITYKLIGAKGLIKEVPVTLGRRVYGRSKINVFREIKNHLRIFWKIVGWRFSGK